MIRTLSFVCLVLATSVAGAASIVVPGIPSFDTNLGTLISATVTIDPDPVFTSPYDSGFLEDVDDHDHLVSPNPVNAGGLAIFTFTPTFTNMVDPEINDSHNHFVNIPPSMQSFSGAGLAWFLNPGNGISSVNILVPPTSMSEGHNHLVSQINVEPSTVFFFEPAGVPEPTGGMLLGLASLMFAVKRLS